MLRRENDGRPRGPASIENPSGRTFTPVHVSTFWDVTSSRPVNIEHSMEIDKPETVAMFNGGIRHDVVYPRTDNVNPFAPVYGSTLGNAPLATPSTGVVEQLSMDQYPSFERQSYMSLLKQQVRPIIKGTSLYKRNHKFVPKFYKGIIWV